MKESLHSINKVFIRKPLYHFTDYKKIPGNRDDLDRFICSLWSDSIFKEALFLGSEDLFNRWKRVLKNNMDISLKDRHKLNVSILKYYIRITTRSTPFGLFSSHSAYAINKQASSSNGVKEKYTRVSSLNIEYLLNIIDYLNSSSKFRNLHRFKVNSSAYRQGTSLRYIEKLKNNGKQEFILSSIEADEVLDLILRSIGENGMTFSELKVLLLNNIEEVSDDDVSQYVDGLIASQFLVTDFDICLNDGKPTDQVIAFISANKKDMSELENLEQRLKQLKGMLLKLDDRLGNDIDLYEEIYKVAEKINLPVPPGSLVHVNLREELKDLTIDNRDLENVKKAISILAAFTPTDNSAETNLSEFGKVFYERYEDQAIPLVEALDTETGVGYKQSQLAENDFSSLVDDLDWPSPEDEMETIRFHKRKHRFWKEVISEASNAGESIDLKKINIDEFKGNAHLLARSFSALTKKVGDKVFVDTVGGNTALGLIARFSTDDLSVQEAVNEILFHEETDENVLHVELLFLPNEKAGNIVLRQVPRKYELAYLTKASDQKKEVSINDLYVQLRNGKFAVFSRKLNKQLKIYHSNAHNYHYNSLPIYQFLCDLQMQDEYNLNLDIGRANFMFYDYIPRITYGNDIILSPATWRLTYKKAVINGSYSAELTEVKSTLKKRGIPRYFYLSHSDNKLLIDSENDITLEILLEELRKRKELILSEFLYDINSTAFDNEIVFSFINEITRTVNHFEIPDFNNNDIKRCYIPGDEWIYYKIYAGNKFLEMFLVELFPQILAEVKDLGLVDRWFFIRYNDPAPHLRIRFHLVESADVDIVINKMNLLLKYYASETIINKVEISTYKREIERYEGEYINFSEAIFFYDSELVLKLKEVCKENDNEWLYILKSIDAYFNLFSFNMSERLKIMESLYESFQQEFNANAGLRKQIDLKFRNYIKEIELIFNLTGDNDKGIEAIETCSTHFQELGKQNIVPKHQAIRLVISFLHMHINRMLKARQRMHEFVIYALLLKYYRSKVGRLKYNS